MELSTIFKTKTPSLILVVIIFFVNSAYSSNLTTTFSCAKIYSLYGHSLGYRTKLKPIENSWSDSQYFQNQKADLNDPWKRHLTLENGEKTYRSYLSKTGKLLLFRIIFSEYDPKIQYPMMQGLSFSISPNIGKVWAYSNNHTGDEESYIVVAVQDFYKDDLYQDQTFEKIKSARQKLHARHRTDRKIPSSQLNEVQVEQSDVNVVAVFPRAFFEDLLEIITTEQRIIPIFSLIEAINLFPYRKM